VARTVVAFFAAAFFAAVFLAAVFFTAVFLAAFLAAVLVAEPPAASTSSPTSTVSESVSRVAATVLVFLAASSATSGETRVTFVISLSVDAISLEGTGPQLAASDRKEGCAQHRRKRWGTFYFTTLYVNRQFQAEYDDGSIPDSVVARKLPSTLRAPAPSVPP